MCHTKTEPRRLQWLFVCVYDERNNTCTTKYFSRYIGQRTKIALALGSLKCKINNPGVLFFYLCCYASKFVHELSGRSAYYCFQVDHLCFLFLFRVVVLRSSWARQDGFGWMRRHPNKKLWQAFRKRVNEGGVNRAKETGEGATY